MKTPTNPVRFSFGQGTHPRKQGWRIHPELIVVGVALAPADSIDELLERYEQARGDLVHPAFFTGSQPWIARRRPSLQVHQLVGEGAPSLGLAEQSRQHDLHGGLTLPHPAGAQASAVYVDVGVIGGEVPPGVESHTRQCPDLHRHELANHTCVICRTCHSASRDVEEAARSADCLEATLGRTLVRTTASEDAWRRRAKLSGLK